MIANTSPIDKLIQNKNPFAGHIVVRSSQVWGKSFPDVASINSHASNAVFDAVEKVSKGERETVGITITAEKGVGKSHIISRIRHRLQTEDNAFFIYVSKYDNLNQIKYEFLQTVASSLRAHGSQNVMQWQEIAAALINEVTGYNHTPQKYIEHIYPKYLNKHSNQFIDKLTEIVLQKKPEITNPYLVRAILWTLSSIHNTYANYWLSGLELTEKQAEVMGLPSSEKEDKEAEGLKTVRQILDIISDYKVPVICFDELDNTEVNEYGFVLAQVIASLVKDLYNSLKRGVFLLAMYSPTWKEQIRVLPQAEAVIDRLVSEQSDRQPLKLNNLNSDDIVAIVSQWLKVFYEENKVTPPHPVYPFDEDKLREFGKSKPTVRSILKWCAENFGNLPKSPTEVIEEYFKNELANVEASIDELMEDNNAISNSLRFAFSSLVGETLEEVKIEAIQDIQSGAADRGFIDFKIIGNDSTVKIGVDVIQKSAGASIGAALRRLIDYEKFDITRGCLVRSKQISPTAKQAKEHLEKLLLHQGGEWVMLQKQDIKPLLAIWFVFSCESYELTKEQIFDFIKKEQIAINNPLIREILSEPSGELPSNLTDDDLPISIPQAVDSSADDIDLNLSLAN
ncbi:MAG: P-loop NTPase fold protein [Cyanobacteria bacterium P01_H01_bin.150]